MLLQAEEWLY